MKKILIMLLIVLMCLPLYGQVGNIVPNSGKISESIVWHKAIRSGSNVLFNSPDTALITGAKDSLYSLIYPVYDKMSIAFQTNSATATSYQLKILGALRPSGLGYNSIPDSCFTTMYWVHCEGEGLGNCYVNTEQDSITAKRLSIPIVIPLAGADAIKIMIESGGDQSGNTTFRGQILRGRE